MLLCVNRRRSHRWNRCAESGVPVGYNFCVPSTTSSFVDTFRTTLDLFGTGVELMRQNIRRQHPASGDTELDSRLRQWFRDRPGAESGDCPGRRVDPGGRRA